MIHSKKYIPLNTLIRAINNNSTHKEGIISTQATYQIDTPISKNLKEKSETRRLKSNESFSDMQYSKEVFSPAKCRRIISETKQTSAQTHSLSQMSLGCRIKKQSEDRISENDHMQQSKEIFHNLRDIKQANQITSRELSKQLLEGNQTTSKELFKEGIDINYFKGRLQHQKQSQASDRLSQHSISSINQCFDFSQKKLSKQSLISPNKKDYFTVRKTENKKNLTNANDRNLSQEQKNNAMIKKKYQLAFSNTSVAKHSAKLLEMLPFSWKRVLESQLIQIEESIKECKGSNQFLGEEGEMSQLQCQISPLDSSSAMKLSQRSYISFSPEKEKKEERHDHLTLNEGDITSKPTSHALEFNLTEMMEEIDREVMSKLIDSQDSFGPHYWKKLSRVFESQLPSILRRIDDICGKESVTFNFLMFLSNFSIWFLNLSTDYIEQRVKAVYEKSCSEYQDRIEILEIKVKELSIQCNSQQKLIEELQEQLSKSEESYTKSKKNYDTQIMLLEEQLQEALTYEGTNESCEQITEKIADLQIFINKLQFENKMSGNTIEDGFHSLAKSLVPKNKQAEDYLEETRRQFMLRHSSDEIVSSQFADHPFLLAFMYNYLIGSSIKNANKDVTINKLELFLNQISEAELQNKNTAESFIDFIIQNADNEIKGFQEIEEIVRCICKNINSPVFTLFCSLLGIAGSRIPSFKIMKRFLYFIQTEEEDNLLSNFETALDVNLNIENDDDDDDDLEEDYEKSLTKNDCIPSFSLTENFASILGFSNTQFFTLVISELMHTSKNKDKLSNALTPPLLLSKIQLNKAISDSFKLVSKFQKIHNSQYIQTIKNQGEDESSPSRKNTNKRKDKSAKHLKRLKSTVQALGVLSKPKKKDQ